MASSSSSIPGRPRGLRGVRSMSSLVTSSVGSPPTFAETMQRYHHSIYTHIASPNQNHCENNAKSRDQMDVFTGLAGTGITTPRKAVIRGDSRSRTGYPADLSRDPDRRRPRPISSDSEISIDWSGSEENSELGLEQVEEEEDMQTGYSSLEQLLARKGFKGGECRVMTPESHKLQASSVNDTPRRKSIIPAAASAAAVQPTPLSSTSASTSTLRNKSSILSLGGLVSSLWGSSGTSPSASASSVQVPAPPSPAASENSTSTSASSDDTATDLSFDKEQTVSRWIKAAAASIEMSTGSSSSCSASSVSSSYTSTNGCASFTTAARTSTDSTVESIQVETPCTSPKTIDKNTKALLFHTARSQQDDGSMLSFEHKEEGSEADPEEEEEHTAESLLREGGVLRQALPAPMNTAKPAAIIKDKRPSLAEIFSNTSSLESVKTAANDRNKSPTPPASPITVVALPRASTSTSTVAQHAETEEAVPISPITAINMSLTNIEPITKPVKAATRTTPTTTAGAAGVAPQPKLLRKATSLHTLRMAACPVLSTGDIVMARPVREATPPLPASMPRAPVPRGAKSSNESNTSRASTPRKGEYPRNAAHRNPRDSPIGETRVVKGIPSSVSSSSSQSPARRGKIPSILDDLEDDMGLWTPPRKKSNSLRRTVYQSNTNDENTPPSSSSSSSSSLATQARRPKLKAKESLECILGKQDIELVNKAKQQVIQQTPAGRKALGQLSSFHRNPLPVPKKDNNPVKAPVGVEGEGKKKETVQSQTLSKKSSISALSGTIKGLFGAATGWAEPSSPPRPASKAPTASRPQQQQQQQRAYTLQSQSPRKKTNTLGSRHPSRRQIMSESMHNYNDLHTRGRRSGEYNGKNSGKYQSGQSRSMILPTIVISDASSEYDDGVPL